jgi:hypothetical protein
MLVVVMLMGGGKPPAKQAGNVPPSQTGDAGTMLPASLLDAAAEPEVAKIKLHIVTDPPKASLYKESEPIGASPQDLELVLRNKEVQITAVLDGYNDGVVNVNPLEHKDGQTIQLRLKKLPKGAPKLPPHHPGSGSGAGSGSGTSHTGNAGGELTGYPGAPGSTVPNK